MKKQILLKFILFFVTFCNGSYAQENKELDASKQVSKLFRSEELLAIKLKFSIKEIKKNTNDSVYIKSELAYLNKDKTWDTLDVEMRTRGNFRLNNCYYPPIKIKIKKEERKGTLFKGNKKLKLVLPCLMKSNNNDFVVKEYMAYKLFEIISPYHFKTRFVDIDFTEVKNKKTKDHNLKGILIEDIKNVAKRFDAKVYDRKMNPKAQEPISSIKNAFFQYMIGNLDYSTMTQHNEKLIYVNKKFTPIPYDFDMSGLVNSSYAIVSAVDDKPLVSSVTERLYRGFKRDPKLVYQVRQEYIDNEKQILNKVDSLKPLFENEDQFSTAKIYITDFFNIIKNDSKFEKEIMKKLRSK